MKSVASLTYFAMEDSRLVKPDSTLSWKINIDRPLDDPKRATENVFRDLNLKEDLTATVNDLRLFQFCVLKDVTNIDHHWAEKPQDVSQNRVLALYKIAKARLTNDSLFVG